MTPDDDIAARLDRHGLVMAVWLAAGFLALALFHYGFGGAGPLWVAAGFGAILAGFAAHVIVNAVLRTGFSAAEVALALVLFLAGTLAFGMATLFSEGFAQRNFLVVVGGMAALVAAVIFYMVTRAGVRGAFEAFDIIRDNNPRRSSRLRDRRGRR